MQLLATYLILLVHMIDTSVANIALVHISADLGVDAYEGHWIITAFGVGVAGAIPFVPKLVEWLGAATALTLVLAVSMLAITLCATADTLLVLSLARFLQGATSGAIALLLQRLLLAYAGPDRKAFGLGLWSSAISIAPVIGPFFGAAMMSVLGWRSMFLIQVPVLFLAALMISEQFSLRYAPLSPRPSFSPLLLFFGVMLGVEVGLDRWLDLGRTDKSEALLYLLAVPICLALLTWRLRQSNERLFDWSLLRNRTYLCYAGGSALTSAVSVSTTVIYTLWLQVQLDLAVMDVAKVLGASGLIAGGLSVLIGRIKYKPVLPILIGSGFLCFLGAFLLCSRLTASASLAALIMPRVLIGFGSALCSPSTFMAISQLDGERTFGANSLGLFLRMLCTNILVLLTTAGARRLELVFKEQELANGFGTPVFMLPDNSALMLEGALTQIASTEAMHSVFLAATVLFILLLFNLIMENMRLFPTPAQDKNGGTF